MTMTRRRFLEQAGVFATSMLLTETGSGMAHMEAAMSDAVLGAGELTPFVDALPLPPLAKSMGTRPNPEHKSEQIPYYKITMREMHVKVHRDLPATLVWGFNDSSPGRLFETRS